MSLSKHTTLESWSLKERKDLHLARKLWHFSGVGLMWLTYSLLGPEICKPLILVVALAFTLFEAARLKRPLINQWVHRNFAPLMRETESQNFSGMTYLFWGAAALAWLFPTPVVSLSLLFLAVGDPVASAVGIKWGKDRIHGNKTLQGFLACFACCMVLTAVFCFATNILVDRLVIVSVAGGLLGAGAETFNFSDIDDNFSMPVISAMGLSLIFYILGAF